MHVEPPIPSSFQSQRRTETRKNRESVAGDDVNDLMLVGIADELQWSRKVPFAEAAATPPVAMDFCYSIVRSTPRASCHGSTANLLTKGCAYREHHCNHTRCEARL